MSLGANEGEVNSPPVQLESVHAPEGDRFPHGGGGGGVHQCTGDNTSQPQCEASYEIELGFDLDDVEFCLIDCDGFV